MNDYRDFELSQSVPEPPPGPTPPPPATPGGRGKTAGLLLAGVVIGALVALRVTGDGGEPQAATTPTTPTTAGVRTQLVAPATTTTPPPAVAGGPVTTARQPPDDTSATPTTQTRPTTSRAKTRHTQAPPKAATQRATAFMRAWARPKLPAKKWFAGVAPYSDDLMRAGFKHTDPANVPASKITGRLTATDRHGPSVTYRVPTNGGALRLVMTSDGRQWWASELEPARGPQDT